MMIAALFEQVWRVRSYGYVRSPRKFCTISIFCEHEFIRRADAIELIYLPHTFIHVETTLVISSGHRI